MQIAVPFRNAMRGTTGQSRESLLQDFVAWSATHITGDEKGEAQTFIERLFLAFGQKGARDVGGTFEHRVKKGCDDGGGTSFDFVLSQRTLIDSAMAAGGRR